MGWPVLDVVGDLRAHMKALKGIDEPKMRISFWTVCETLD